MWAVVREPSFALLWVAGLISSVGDWLLFVALPFYVYQHTGSTLATGALFLAQMAPSLLLGSVAGVFVDRWDRRRTMVAVDLARALLLPVLLTVHGRGDLPRVYAVAFLLAALGQFFGPAKGALLPRLVASASLLPANGLTALGDNLPRLVGPALGGLLFGARGLPGAVLADSASFLASGLLLAAIRVPAATPARPATTPTHRTGAASVWREWRDGLRAVGADRVARTLLAVEGVAIVGQGILDVLLVPFIRGVMHGDAQAFGWLLTVQAIGGLLGALVVARRGAILAPARLFGLSLGANGVLLAAIAHAPALPLIFALIAIAGVPVVGWLVGGQTLLQQSVTDRYRGRLYGAYGTTSALTRLSGMGLASIAGDRVGVVPLLTAAGGLHIAAAVGALVLLRATSPPHTAADGITVKPG